MHQTNSPQNIILLAVLIPIGTAALVGCPPEPPVCNSDADCDDGQFCNGTETCDNGECQSDSEPCNDSEICNEGADRCDECDSDDDCNDGDPCSEDDCDAGQCSNDSITDCCTADSVDCGDGDVCTSDDCVNNTCVNEPIADCCTDDSDCGAGETCNLDTNRCETQDDNLNENIPENSNDNIPDNSNDNIGDNLNLNDNMENDNSGLECTVDDDCPEGELCDISTHTCVECLDDADCDDGDTCTTDSCDDGGCSLFAIQDCCVEDADCDNGDFCDGEESCDIATNLCQEGVQPCEEGASCDEESDECESLLEWIYFSDSGTDSLRRVMADGTGLTDLVMGQESVYGLALDRSAEKMYWTELNGGVRRSNLDGTGVETIVYDETLFNSEYGIALDVSADRIYWLANNKTIVPNETAIFESSLSGNSPAVFVSGVGELPFHLAIDSAAGWLYWTDQGIAANGSLWRVNLDDEAIDPVVITGVTIEDPRGMALDVANQRLYWTDNFSAAGVYSGPASDGAGELVCSDAGQLYDLALDLTVRKAYWTNSTDGTIKVGNLDDPCNTATVMSGLSPRAIALDVE